MTAACDLTIRDTGRVLSTGAEPGADLVHLEGGCAVEIEGLVASTGGGRIVPNNPPNSCAGVTLAAKAVRRNPTVRLDKPSFSTSCVEVWAGNSLTIRRDVPGLNGEINADTGIGGTPNLGIGWVDLFARGDISILSAADPAVHANGLGDGAGDSEEGGLVTVKSRDGKVVARGLALQASAGTAGADGGAIAIEAMLDVDLGSGPSPLGAASLDAKGNAVGSTSKGGKITARSFTGAILSDAPSTLDVSGGAANGVVQLTACGATGFPPGSVVQATPVEISGACGGQPGLSSYVVLPDCPCLNGIPPSFCDQLEVRAVLNSVTGMFPGNKGPDVVVDARVGSIQDALDAASDANQDGYIIVAVIANDGGLLGGHVNQTVEINRAYPKRFALLGCSATLHATDMPARPAGHITAGASSPPGSAENIFVMNLYASDSGVAGWLIEGDGRLLRATRGIGNAVGVKFLGNNNTMKIVRSASNTGAGVVVVGNGNQLVDIDAWANGADGVVVSGDGNLLDGVDAGDRGKGNAGNGITVTGAGNKIVGCDAFANLGHGVFVSGNGNQIDKSNAGERSKGNGLDGFRVEGGSNVLSENDAFSNQRNGVVVKGDGNSIKLGRAGDAGSANGVDGLAVDGNANALDGNKVNGNTGAGIRITGTANTLKNNRSNDGSLGSTKTNLGGQYCTSDGSTLDLGGNKKDNVNYVGTGTPKKYPAGCVK